MDQMVTKESIWKDILWKQVSDQINNNKYSFLKELNVYATFNNFEEGILIKYNFHIP